MNSLERAKNQDNLDPLARFKSSFQQVENEIYLDGNSLGKLPLQTKPLMEEIIAKQWGNNLIRSWNTHWLDLPKRLSAKLAELINAKPKEITVGESTSVNLYKIAFALLASGKYTKQLLTDNLNFPTDNYILEGLAQSFNTSNLKVLDYETDLMADLDLLKTSISSQPGILCLSLVSYKSAYVYPMRELNELAKAMGSIIIWDFSHAIGAIDIDVKESNCLVAVGCTYKYLNGGPGAPAFLYVNEKVLPNLNSPVQGWFGHAKPFDFSPQYQAAKGITKFEAGTPNILSLAPIEVGLDLCLDAGIKSIHAKSKKLVAFFIEEIKRELLPLGFTLESPENHQSRGSHVTLSHEESWRICQCLLTGNKNHPKIIPDFRPNRFLRFGIAPLYIGFEDLWVTVNRLKEIILKEEYQKYSSHRPTVT